MFRFQKNSRHRALVLLGILLIAVAFTAYSQSQESPQMDYGTLPTSLPRGASLTDAAQFAWNQFLFLNTKAAPVTQSTPRGTPDPSGALGLPGDTLLWQTWAHKVELRPNQPLTTPWDELGPPDYQKNKAYQVPIQQGTSDAEWNLWNNLDEDNEIGSCLLYGRYQTQSEPAYSPPNLVMYQVKVNKDEYEYIRTNFGKDQNLPNKFDSNGNPEGPTGALYQAQMQVVKNIKNAPYSYYSGAGTGPGATCDCGPQEKAICLPCGGYVPTKGAYPYPDGAIEVKSAWRKLLPSDDSSRYYTTTAVYYERDARDQIYKYYNGTFALIGIHIIRKLVTYPDFVFTTFEHVDVETSDYQYYTLSLSTGYVMNGPTAVVRQTGQTNRSQNHPIPETIKNVNSQFQGMLEENHSSSVWKYYRLTGVQADSVDCPVSPTPPASQQALCRMYQDPVTCTNLDPNYFMANFVIESDPQLNNFSGPGFGSNPFGDCRNTIYNNHKYNNGGCKGCHGVAQTSFGTDFSFLLDFDEGKPAVMPDTIRYEPSFMGYQGPVFDVLYGSDTTTTFPGATPDSCADACRDMGDSCDFFSYTPFPLPSLCSFGAGNPSTSSYQGALSYVKNGVPIPK